MNWLKFLFGELYSIIERINIQVPILSMSLVRSNIAQHFNAMQHHFVEWLNNELNDKFNVIIDYDEHEHSFHNIDNEEFWKKIQLDYDSLSKDKLNVLIVVHGPDSDTQKHYPQDKLAFASVVKNNLPALNKFKEDDIKLISLMIGSSWDSLLDESNLGKTFLTDAKWEIPHFFEYEAPSHKLHNKHRILENRDEYDESHDDHYHQFYKIGKSFSLIKFVNAFSDELDLNKSGNRFLEFESRWMEVAKKKNIKFLQIRPSLQT